MKKVTVPDRLLFVLTIILASYLIVKGFSGFTETETTLLSIAMGVLVIAGLLLLLFGFEILENKAVVVVATITPLSLSLSLIVAYLPQFSLIYWVLVMAGFFAILFTRYFSSNKVAAMVLAPVHGIAGLIIFLLPVVFSLNGQAPSRFALVGVGGALFGIGGLLLAFLKSGKPLLSKETIFSILPALLVITTACFVLGF